MSNTFVTANMTSSTHNMASSTSSSRMFVTTQLKDSSELSIFRHQLLPTPTHDLLDTATAPQLIATTIIHLKSLSIRGYRQLFKQNNIADLIMSPFFALTFYCLVAFLAFHTKIVTLCTACALGLAIFLVMILETYNTIYAMMMRLEFTLERITTIATYLFCAAGPLGLLVFSYDCMQKEDNAAREQQHRKERSTSEIKVQPYNDLIPEDHYALKADKNTEKQQDDTILYVSDPTLQNKSSKAQPATYKNVTPDLNTGQEPKMKTAEDYLFSKATEVQPRESTFQMTLRKAMHRSKRPRRTRPHMSISVKECSNEESYLKEGFRMTVWSEDEASGENSGTSTPDSEGSTLESDFQAGLRMMLGSACRKRRRGRKGKRSGPSTLEYECSSQESEFQTKFREAVWPEVSSKRRTSTPGSETSSGESDFQAEFRAVMGLDGRKRQEF